MLHSVVRLYKKIDGRFGVPQRSCSEAPMNSCAGHGRSTLRGSGKTRPIPRSQPSCWAACSAPCRPRRCWSRCSPACPGLAVNQRQRASCDVGHDVHRWNDDADGTDLY
jgi:hypothetical protein